MTCKFLHHFVAYFVQDKMWVSLQKFFKDRPELKQHRTAQQRRKYFADSGIEMMPNKQGEEGVLLNVQEAGTMMVRVGRKMSSSKEKVEKHENQASQDAKHAKLSSQLEVKSYDKEVLEAAHQSSSSDSYSSSSSDDTSDTEESGFGLSAQKKNGKPKKKVKQTPTRVSTGPPSSSKGKKASPAASPPAKETSSSENRTGKASDDAQAALHALQALSFDSIWNPAVGSRERDIQAKLHRAETCILALNELETPGTMKLIECIDSAISIVKSMQSLSSTLKQDGGADILIEGKDYFNTFMLHSVHQIACKLSNVMNQVTESWWVSQLMQES